MKERPILFSAPMVRAILDGTKTQTRRAMPDQVMEPGIVQMAGPGHCEIINGHGVRIAGFRCRYGQPGDRLWVRESGAKMALLCPRDPEYPFIFRHDEPATRDVGHYWVQRTRAPGASYSTEISRDDFLRHPSAKAVPSIHMPRWASRITLEITGVRVERLQDISRGDAMAEGCPFPNMAAGPNPREWYADLWNSLNAANRPKLPSNTNSRRYARVKAWLDKNPDQTSWDANPWVWVIEFKRLKAA